MSSENKKTSAIPEPEYGRPEVLSLPPLQLSRTEALGYLGYAGQTIDEQLLARFETLADVCERNLRPVCVCALYPMDGLRTQQDESQEIPLVALKGCDLALPGRDIAAHLSGACEVALMACTLGAASERELRKYAALGSVDALLYGAAASALVEAAANAAESIIVERADARNLRTSFRYSPGYGDLPLSVQPAFLDALDATRRVGIAATQGSVLVPVKSVTAVLGLFAGAVPDAAMRPLCSTCQLQGRCPLHERGVTCHDR